jgi:hypothetical protein
MIMIAFQKFPIFMAEQSTKKTYCRLCFSYQLMLIQELLKKEQFQDALQGRRAAIF